MLPWPLTFLLLSKLYMDCRATAEQLCHSSLPHWLCGQVAHLIHMSVTAHFVATTLYFLFHTLCVVTRSSASGNRRYRHNCSLVPWSTSGHKLSKCSPLLAFERFLNWYRQSESIKKEIKHFEILYLINI